MSAQATESRSPLLQAILDDPTDAARRLVFADWLEEYGDEADRERAEFIRVQIELTRGDFSCGMFMYSCGENDTVEQMAKTGCEKCKPWAKLTLRESSLLDGALLTWNSLPGWVDEWWFTRGFVSRVRLTQQAWIDHGPAIIRAHPIERVELSDKEPREDNGRFSWYEEMPGAPMPWSLDAAIFRALLSLGYVQGELGDVPWSCKETALIGLSRACLAFARISSL